MAKAINKLPPHVREHWSDFIKSVPKGTKIKGAVAKVKYIKPPIAEIYMNPITDKGKARKFNEKIVLKEINDDHVFYLIKKSTDYESDKKEFDIAAFYYFRRDNTLEKIVKSFFDDLDIGIRVNVLTAYGTSVSTNSEAEFEEIVAIPIEYKIALIKEGISHDSPIAYIDTQEGGKINVKLSTSVFPLPGYVKSVLEYSLFNEEDMSDAELYKGLSEVQFVKNLGVAIGKAVNLIYHKDILDDPELKQDAVSLAPVISFVSSLFSNAYILQLYKERPFGFSRKGIVASLALDNLYFPYDMAEQVLTVIIYTGLPIEKFKFVAESPILDEIDKIHTEYSRSILTKALPASSISIEAVSEKVKEETHKAMEKVLDIVNKYDIPYNESIIDYLGRKINFPLRP